MSQNWCGVYNTLVFLSLHKTAEVNSCILKTSRKMMQVTTCHWGELGSIRCGWDPGGSCSHHGLCCAGALCGTVPLVGGCVLRAHNSFFSFPIQKQIMLILACIGRKFVCEHSERNRRKW